MTGLPRCVDVIGPANTRALLALLVVHRTQGHATLTEVGLAAGGLPKTTIYQQLESLRSLGLVGMERGSHGSLRPLVRQVPIVHYSP